MSATSTTLTILGALAAGICVGLLIAPDKGSETRKRVTDTIGDWADKVKELFTSAQEEVEGLKYDGKRTATAAAQ